MFESYNGTFDIQKTHINGKGDYVITAGLTNNGILGKTDIKSKIFDENTITVDMFGFSFYRQFKYKMVTHARVFSLKAKFEVSKSQGLFLSNSLHFLNKKFGYENMCSWEKIKYEKIQLPINKNGEIDFDFMEMFIAELEAERIAELEAERIAELEAERIAELEAERIAELEAERIAELEAYLLATGLKDYNLTKQEQQALDIFNNEQVDFKEFKIGELFEVKSYKKRFDANKIQILENGVYPYIVRTSVNNGQKGFINQNEEFLNEGNTISFGQDTATMFYQEKPYFTGDKIKILKPTVQNFDKIKAHFFISVMSKAFKSFSWGSSSFNVKIIETQKIQLPIKNGEIDFDFMETLISAIQKLVIKDVVLYADKKINETKNVVNKKI